MADKQVPIALNGDEVREALVYKIDEAIDEQLKKSCHMSGTNAYTSFTAEISIKVVLNDYGRQVRDNCFARAEGEPFQPTLAGVPLAQSEVIQQGFLMAHPETLAGIEAQFPPKVVEIELPIAAAPPNQVRIDTHQDVPIRTIEDGKPVIKRQKYQPRKAQK